MLWLRRPPYLRWLVATLVLAAGLWAELAPDGTVDHPVLLGDVRAGELVTADMVEMRPVPVGLLRPVSLPAAASGDLRRGDPLVAGPARRAVPDGWWALELPVPPSAAAGLEVRVAVVPDGVPAVHPGVVANAPRPDGFDGSVALVAVPEAAVPEVTSALARGHVTVLVGG